MFEGVTILTTFAIAMTMVVLMPKLMERLRLPAILGFIIAGFLLGPAAMGLIKEDGPVIYLLAELGKLLFMFFVGFEIDLDDFKKTRTRSITFGVLTFILPFAAGVLVGRLTGFGWNASLLIGSIIASHTLLAFPILQKLGLTQHPTVLMVVGGTIFTDIASMLVLAVTVSVHLTGFSWSFLGKEMLELAIFVPLILFGAGNLARKAIIRYGQKPELRVTIMLVVIVVCAEGARIINLEGIVGAFLAGIAVKRAVRGKFAVEQLEVTSQALFIPAFFLTTGFLVDPVVLKQSITESPGMTFGMLAGVLAGKTVAALLTGLIFRQSRPEMGTVASLSFPQMAATLASAVVGYQCINSQGVRLLDATFVNASVLIVIVTCVLGPILTERYAKQMRQDATAEAKTSSASESEVAVAPDVATERRSLCS
ncbi:Kef-type K+ transport system membrane component KefB [Roseimicrobium gellanilyticum]|uniref:Kef-type K+ transport system membrane component KefB n=1 Tax=Roseimicrobium gellanilyticum TaxID=748857 RepID=A0A366H2S7_9BACT|nr:cation:proton antiporter [Roseimicrobium gellanilyticum]RBP35352.1 Kef-type K+ transport system membrane component KefB [Roseimicrobium gellanilyticum]